MTRDTKTVSGSVGFVFGGDDDMPEKYNQPKRVKDPEFFAYKVAFWIVVVAVLGLVVKGILE